MCQNEAGPGQNEAWSSQNEAGPGHQLTKPGLLQQPTENCLSGLLEQPEEVCPSPPLNIRKGCQQVYQFCKEGFVRFNLLPLN